MFSTVFFLFSSVFLASEARQDVHEPRLGDLLQHLVVGGLVEHHQVRQLLLDLQVTTSTNYTMLVMLISIILP